MIGREALAALARAWVVTTIATMALSAALAAVPMWDTAIFMQALREAATSDPSFAQGVKPDHCEVLACLQAAAETSTKQR